MRDLLPKKDQVTDPTTGSTLQRVGTSGSGGVYRFGYRTGLTERPVEFEVTVNTFTPYIFDRYREKQGLPKVNSITELVGKFYPEFTAHHGDFRRVEEWYLVGTDGKPLMGPSEAQRTWSAYTPDEARQIIDTFYRVYFELTARRPGVTSDDPAERYYPDLLKFEPYDLPRQLIQERRAAPGKEI